VCIYYWLNFFFALSWFAVLLFSCLKGDLCDLCDFYDLHDAVLSSVALDRACPVSTWLRGVHCLGHRHAGKQLKSAFSWGLNVNGLSFFNSAIPALGTIR
jgi:hypothetical protein